MATNSFSPRFIKARIGFTYEGRQYTAGEFLINSRGVPGFAWSAFDPMENLGKRVQVMAHVLSSTPWDFQCIALISCEQSGVGAGTSLGFDFLIAGDDQIKLDAAIEVEGVLPDFVRKYPRIHYNPAVPVFPSHAIVRFFYNKEDIAVSCDLDNLSPTGVQVVTEDNRTGSLLPNETVRLQIQPRGPWLRQIQVNAQVKRVIHGIDPMTGNTRRYFGLGIAAFSAEAKVNFTDLLRQIISQAKR
ncbi:MAG: hypothetical protein HY074_04440 [Deltaproteobacteria bacterium]|nr:hypothetical protein [Deltaproteobacteria bacterium]